MKKFVVLSFVLTMIVSSFSSISAQAYTTEDYNPFYDINNFELIELSESSDEDLEIALEIANSNLEEKAFLKNGKYVNFYKNHKKANVSKKAFDIFNEKLKVINELLENGQLENLSSLTDTQEIVNFIEDIQKNNLPDYSVIQPMASVDRVWYGHVISISASEASKIQKVLAAGGGITGLLAIPSIALIGPVWAASIVAIYGLGEVCNWNNKGYNIHVLAVPVAGMRPLWCTPK